MTKIVKYPFGAASSLSVAFDASANMVAAIENQESFVDIGQMTDDGTIDLSIGAEVKAGANLCVKASADGTDDADPSRTLTLGTGLTGKAQALLPTVHYIFRFKHDGSKFIHRSTTKLSADPPAH